ncbi:oxidoreductase family protein [Sunxiuqinia sp. A32]|uniref:oxidoreductase family protein n=1 Tax=Sunxiuqinia sp. A32 TaxID=3461496 RepID=UPI004045277A
MIDKHFQEIIRKACEAKDVFEIETIQELWSGYGSIVRYGLEGSTHQTVVVKHVRYPKGSSHPRGWNTDLSHERKLKSYQVETAWYKQWSHLCDENCRIPKCLAIETKGDEVLMVMEDMDEAGFPARKSSVNWINMETCIRWLANFHATFLHEKPSNLWDVGTYWHLETRPDEWKILTDTALKHAAKEIDQILQNSPYQTFVHGDAKLANFCFSPDGKNVAAVDFQYVGGGCGMKDLAYFVGSCLYEEDCEQLENQILDTYFNQFRIAAKQKNLQVNVDTLEKDWRNLYPVAWTDFHRFLKGWSPGHWKINSYSERLAREVVKQLNS